MYSACPVLALALCAAVGMSAAQDKGLPGNYEHLKKLEPLIGTLRPSTRTDRSSSLAPFQPFDGVDSCHAQTLLRHLAPLSVSTDTSISRRRGRIRVNLATRRVLTGEGGCVVDHKP